MYLFTAVLFPVVQSVVEPVVLPAVQELSVLQGWGTQAELLVHIRTVGNRQGKSGYGHHRWQCGTAGWVLVEVHNPQHSQ